MADRTEEIERRRKNTQFAAFRDPLASRSRRKRRRKLEHSTFILATLLISSIFHGHERVLGFQGPQVSIATKIRKPRVSTASHRTPCSLHRHRGPFSVQLHSTTTKKIGSNRLSPLFDSEAPSIVVNGEVAHASSPRPSVVVNGASSKEHIELTSVNGASSLSKMANGVTVHSNGTATEMDMPLPTANGGYTHTTASRAKISAANKGRTPWNKGKARSEEVKARIAAGVRAKNRERFLEKLKDMGLTEEEYEAKKKEERRRRDAERRDRRTEKGGYRPTEETKKKISEILKAKWAKGEVKKRTVNPEKVRRGFTHSHETRAKISESLRKRWAEDPEYRAKMVNVAHESNSQASVKQKISEALKKKWQDPEFREAMLAKMSSRKKPAGPHDPSHREKISAAMKAKWQDEEYRTKTLNSIRKHREEVAASRPVQSQPASKPKKAKAKSPATTSKKPKQVDRVRMVTPSEPKTKAEKIVKKRRKETVSLDEDGNPIAKVVKQRAVKANAESSDVGAPKKVEPDGSINRLREERRDLYDLLYGDEITPVDLALGDENLDTFDPYGLEDF